MNNLLAENTELQAIIDDLDAISSLVIDAPQADNAELTQFSLSVPLAQESALPSELTDEYGSHSCSCSNSTHRHEFGRSQPSGTAELPILTADEMMIPSSVYSLDPISFRESISLGLDQSSQNLQQGTETKTSQNPLNAEIFASTSAIQQHTTEDPQDEKVTMVMVLDARSNCKLELERCIRRLLEVADNEIGLSSSMLILPPAGESRYVVVLAHKSKKELLQLLSSSENAEFIALLVMRDSLLESPVSYQFERGNSLVIEPRVGLCKAMNGGVYRPVVNVDEEAYRRELECTNESCHNPEGLQVKASFVSMDPRGRVFSSKYLRNHKKGGTKNMRCFPTCHDGIHVASGYCGDSIKVHVSISRVTSTGGIKLCALRASTSSSMSAFARFVPDEESGVDAEELHEISGPLMKSGTLISYADVESLKRTKEFPLRPWVQGKFKGSAGDGGIQKALFEFNAESRPWHYGWGVPRRVHGDTYHYLEILLFKPFKGQLYCVHTMRSDPFTIGSSRQHGTTTQSPETFSPPPAESPSADSTAKKRKHNCDVVTANEIPWADFRSMFAASLKESANESDFSI